jgi:hypothetical protein
MITYTHHNAPPASVAVLIGERSKELVTKDEKQHLAECAVEYEALQAELTRHGWQSGRQDYLELSKKYQEKGGLSDLKKAELKSRCTEKHTVQRKFVKNRLRRHYVDNVRELLTRVYERAAAIVLDTVKRMEADARKAADTLGIPYVEPPVVESAKRSWTNLNRNAAELPRSQAPQNIRRSMADFGVSLE